MTPIVSEKPAFILPPLQTFKNRVLSLPSLLLIPLYVFIAWTRYRNYHEPIPCDLTLYSSYANEILYGRKLYSDLWDEKPPAIYVTYAFVELVAGYGNTSIYLLGLSAALLTLLGIYKLCRMMGGHNSTGLFGALLWALVSGDLLIEANQPNVEVFINAVTVWLFYFFLKFNYPDTRSTGTLVLGFLSTLLTLYKQFLVLTVIFLAAAHYLMAPKEDKKKAFHQVLTVGGMVLFGWVVVISYFSITGRFVAFWRALFEFSYYYATTWKNLNSGPMVAKSTSMIGNLVAGLSPERALPSKIDFLLPLFLLSFTAALFNLRKERRPWTMFAVLLISTFITISIPGKFYSHYYQLWLPPLCIGTAWSLEWVWRKFTAIPSLCLGLAVLAVVGNHEFQYFRLSPLDGSKLKYGDFFVYEEPVSKIINKLLLPGETYYEWSAVPMFYHSSGRRLPVGNILGETLFDTPLAPEFTKEVLEDLSLRKPELIIVDSSNLPWDLGNVVKHPVTKFIVSHYVPLGTFGSNRRRFKFLMRAGGALEQRIHFDRK